MEFLRFCPWNWGTRKRVDTAPKASGCFLGGTQEIFGAVSEDLLGGTGKAEDAKLPGAGMIPKPCPTERAETEAMQRNRVQTVITGGGATRIPPRSSIKLGRSVCKHCA